MNWWHHEWCHPLNLKFLSCPLISTLQEILAPLALISFWSQCSLTRSKKSMLWSWGDLPLPLGYSLVFTPVPRKWEKLANLTSLHTVPWTVVGDFIDVSSHSEKFGALPLCLCWITSFQRCISACNSYRFHWL